MKNLGYAIPETFSLLNSISGFQFIYLSIYLSIYLPTYLPTYLSLHNNPLQNVEEASPG